MMRVVNFIRFDVKLKCFDLQRATLIVLWVSPKFFRHSFVFDIFFFTKVLMRVIRFKWFLNIVTVLTKYFRFN